VISAVDSAVVSVRVLCPISQTDFKSLPSGRYNERFRLGTPDSCQPAGEDRQAENACRGAGGAVGRFTGPACRTDACSSTQHQFTASRPAWAVLVFAGPAIGSSRSSFSALTQSSTSFFVFAAAPNIQLMSFASDLFSRWFSAFDHGNLL
jgi:hypothetical protein